MTTSLHFAHMTDVHISEKGDSWSTLGGPGAELLRECFAQLNRIDDLDFVLITGDVLDLATQNEVATFVAALNTLEKPWHFIPGNHDGFIDPNFPESYRPAEAIPLIDPRMAEPLPEANQSYWSRTVAPGVQLIGLDSRIPNDWSGIIHPPQMDWLQQELDQYRYDTVLIAIHHPTHNLGPHNEREWFDKFILRNGEVLERLLNQYPAVKMVIAGHHHANQIDLCSGRMHLNTAALTGYPCVYRTVRLVGQEGEWRTRVESHLVGSEEIREQARQAMLDSSSANRFAPGYPEEWVNFCVGREIDQFFDGVLEGDSED